MPGASRQGADIAGGVIVEGSADVYCNGRPLVRINDRVQSHGKAKHSATFMIQGSSSVYCNGRPVCFQSCVASCGHAATGSSDVFVGG